MKKKGKLKNKRSFWFRCLKGFMKLFIKKPTFVYLGEKIKPGSLILSNHEGTSAPLAFELYLNEPIRLWGAWQMNSNLVQLYKYQTKEYYHGKKHWNLFAARMFCLIASPLTWIFYRGLKLISVYKDTRFRTTIKESIQTIKNGQSVVIYPEDSTKGYLPVLEGFHAGFVLLANACLKEGIDLPIHLAYLNKAERKYIIDEPIMFSTLANLPKEEISKKLCDRLNSISGVNQSSNTTSELDKKHEEKQEQE